MESAVTRLLVSIKALLESLTKWSEQTIDENAVSDVYVQFGNDFNTAVAAFASFNIDMTWVLSCALCTVINLIRFFYFQRTSIGPR